MWADYSRVDPRLELGDSGIAGRGLFAVLPIEEGATCIVFGGRLTDLDTLHALVDYSALAVGPDEHLVQQEDDPVRFLNHSCDSNLWLADAITAVARRRIGIGEEVTLDYALLSDDSTWRMPCRCGAESCRGVITADDWRREEVQQRYAGHFSPFLNLRIAGLA